MGARLTLVRRQRERTRRLSKQIVRDLRYANAVGERVLVVEADETQDAVLRRLETSPFRVPNRLYGQMSSSKAELAFFWVIAATWGRDGLAAVDHPVAAPVGGFSFDRLGLFQLRPVYCADGAFAYHQAMFWKVLTLSPAPALTCALVWRAGR